MAGTHVVTNFFASIFYTVKVRISLVRFGYTVNGINKTEHNAFITSYYLYTLLVIYLSAF